MTHRWQMQDAKAKFSEVVKLATNEGPQIVTYRGVETAVVLSIGDFHRLEANRPSLIDYLLAGPKFDEDAIAVINERSRDAGRVIEI